MPCVKQHTKKYATRASPPYPANECAGARKKGNDGQWYRSKAASNGVHRWHLEGSKSKPVKKVPSSSTKGLKKGARYLLKYGRGSDVLVYYIGTSGNEVEFGETKFDVDYVLIKEGKSYYNGRDMAKVTVKAI